MLKMQGEFSGIKLNKFSTLMVNARKKPTPFDHPNALNFDLSEAQKKNNEQKLMARREKKHA